MANDIEVLEAGIRSLMQEYLTAANLENDLYDDTTLSVGFLTGVTAGVALIEVSELANGFITPELVREVVGKIADDHGHTIVKYKEQNDPH